MKPPHLAINGGVLNQATFSCIIPFIIHNLVNTMSLEERFEIGERLAGGYRQEVLGKRLYRAYRVLYAGAVLSTSGTFYTVYQGEDGASWLCLGSGMALFAAAFGCWYAKVRQ